MKRIFGPLLVAVLLSASFCGYAYADKGKIFVFREADGSIRFTNRQPPKGVNAEVFTAKGKGFSYYTSPRGRGKIFPNLYNAIIQSAARLHGIDAGLIKAVIHVESAFNPRAISPKGARGLMQLMPGTAKDLGVVNSFNPHHNIYGGARYLAQLLKRHEGNVQYALAAYNAGPEAVSKYRGIPPYSETINYVRRVMAMKKRYAGGSATS